jgi:protein YIPF5/7
MYSSYGGQQEPWNPYGNRGASTQSYAFEDEPPILEELEIDVGAIIQKSISILTARVGADSLRDIDMGGPLLFAASLATIHLMHGKLHFGVLFGWSVVAFMLFWFTVHQLAGHGAQSQKECIDLYNCSGCLGYCLLPMIVANVIGLFLPRGSAVSAILLTLVSFYCAFLSGKLVTKRAVFLQHQLWTIVYPAFLYYATIALLSMY